MAFSSPIFVDFSVKNDSLSLINVKPFPDYYYDCHLLTEFNVNISLSSGDVVTSEEYFECFRYSVHLLWPLIDPLWLRDICSLQGQGHSPWYLSVTVRWQLKGDSNCPPNGLARTSCIACANHIADVGNHCRKVSVSRCPSSHTCRTGHNVTVDINLISVRSKTLDLP